MQPEPDVLLRGGRAGCLRVHACAAATGARGQRDERGEPSRPSFAFGVPAAAARPPPGRRHRAAASGGGDGGDDARAADPPPATITAAAFAPGSSGLLVLGTSTGDALAVRLRAGRFRLLGPAAEERSAAAGGARRGRGLCTGGAGGARARAVTCATFLPAAPVAAPSADGARALPGAAATAPARAALGYGDGRLRIFEFRAGAGRAASGGAAAGRCEGELVPPPGALASGRGAPVACLSSAGTAAPGATFPCRPALLVSVTAHGAVLWRGGGGGGGGGSGSGGGHSGGKDARPGPSLSSAAPLRPMRCFSAEITYPAKWAAVTPDGRAVLVVGGEGACAGAAAAATAAATAAASAGDPDATAAERERQRRLHLPQGRERGAVLTAMSAEDGRVLGRASLPVALPEGEGVALAASAGPAAATAFPSCFALSPDGANLAVGYTSHASSAFYVLMVDVARFQSSRWLALTPSAPTAATAAAAARAAGGRPSGVRQLAFMPNGHTLAALVVGPSSAAVAFAHVVTGAVDGAVLLAPPPPPPPSLAPGPPLLFAMDAAADTLVVAGPGGQNKSSVVSVYDLPALRESWWRRREEQRLRRKETGAATPPPLLSGAAIAGTDTSAAGAKSAATAKGGGGPSCLLTAIITDPHAAPRSLARDKAAWAANVAASGRQGAGAGGASLSSTPSSSTTRSSSSSSPPPQSVSRLLLALEACGSFPHQHRARIWSRLLRLPENDAAFAALDAGAADGGGGGQGDKEDDREDEDEDDEGGGGGCGSSGGGGRLAEPPVLAGRNRRAESRVCAALERWFPPLGQPYDALGDGGRSEGGGGGGGGEDDRSAETATATTTATLAARLARPLSHRVAFGRDARAGFECAATLLLHWCGGWLDWAPGPPLRLLRRLFALLRLHDRELADALQWRAPLALAAAATSGAWDWLSAAGGAEALRPGEWARVWDWVLCDGAAAAAAGGSTAEAAAAAAAAAKSGEAKAEEAEQQRASSPVGLLYHVFAAWMMFHREALLRLSREAAAACAAVEAASTERGSGGKGGGGGAERCALRERRSAALRRLRAFFGERHPLGPGGASRLLRDATRLREATPPAALVGADDALAPPGRLGASRSHGALPPAGAMYSTGRPAKSVDECYPPPRAWPLASVAAMRRARRRAAGTEAALERGRRAGARLSALERTLEHDVAALAPGRSARLRGELLGERRRAAAAAEGDSCEEARREGQDEGAETAAAPLAAAAALGRRAAAARRAASQVASARAEEHEEAEAAERCRRGLKVVAERRYG